MNDPSPEFASSYARILASGQSPYIEEARAYIKRVREQHGRYEGVVRPSDRPALKANTARIFRLGGLIDAVRNYLHYRGSIAATDNHVPNPLRTILYTALLNPFRARQASRFLHSHYVTAEALSNLRYVFSLCTQNPKCRCLSTAGHMSTRLKLSEC